METSAGADTLSTPVPVIEPNVALMVAAPAPCAVATPVPLIVATLLGELIQTTELVRFWVPASLYIPVAASAFVSPLGTVEFEGLTAIETKEAADTTRKSVPLIDPDVAVTVAVPMAWAAARPVLLMAAMPDGEAVQVTALVRSWVVPSLYFPVAVNCCGRPLETTGLGGVTAIETKGAGDTVSLVALLIVPDEAVTMVAPDCLVTAMPEELTAATVGCVLFHVTFWVMSCWLPSLNEPVTRNCSLLPSESTGLAGEIESELRDLAAGVVAPGKLFPPQPDRPIASKKRSDAVVRLFSKRSFSMRRVIVETFFAICCLLGGRLGSQSDYTLSVSPTRYNCQSGVIPRQ
jgi:hypothetical protein